MSRRWALAAGVAGVILAGWAAPARGQLTSADVEALRERGAREGWTFTVGENAATERPLSQLCGLVEPPGWQANVPLDNCTPQRDLPSRFTTWDSFASMPIRDQGPCGSCWAFGAVGAVESAIRLRTTWMVDLSEQWLVSCSTAGTCAGGWHTTSFDYMLHNGLKDACNGGGAVLEADFPYTATDAPCHCPYPHPYSLDSWAMVGPGWGVATAEQIKQAIYDHGPVTTCVYVNNAFQAYYEGVFNASEEKEVNHAVVLVGWDDSLGAHGAWKLRNSWGKHWGIQGYMWIEYGCSMIGYATCYVETDWTDCNGNGIHDAIDIRLGRSADCNHNNIPDECDIAIGLSMDANGNGIPDECELRHGDLNCDGVVTFADINPFVLALSSQSGYLAQYPSCLWLNADCNGDGVVSFADINPFVSCLSLGDCP